ncbi:hypothetical protein [Xenorhabdus sp. KJ12.1]|uniref:hypothetical protein n=1 Tax=Xenorhabdus sp. KJ12.1 TaxID=1851571 RepID=UPI000C0420D8|nr:hypothetical protein [Xenorhabdus sp. KJ12.1]PHM72252.1 hypothetical protein Xekj_00530 [Xenorhabdus sp. KJ12.1]
MKTLNNAQIYTLRRLSSGTLYMLRGDRCKAFERRNEVSYSLEFDDINAPSLPVLFRLGLVEFSLAGNKVPTMFYPVRLTQAGQETAATMQVMQEV